jgi:hypothetical protein
MTESGVLIAIKDIYQHFHRVSGGRSYLKHQSPDAWEAFLPHMEKYADSQ